MSSNWLSFNQCLTASAPLASAPGKQKASRGWEKNTGTDSSVVCQSTNGSDTDAHIDAILLNADVSHTCTAHMEAEQTVWTCMHICIHRYIYMLSQCSGEWLNKADGGRTCRRVDAATENVLIWVCCLKACRPNAYGWLQCLGTHAVELLYCTWSYRRSQTAFVKRYEAKCLWEWGDNSVD